MNDFQRNRAAARVLVGELQDQQDAAQVARRATRRRVITTASLSVTGSALFLAPQLLPGADPSAFTVMAGLTFPAAVGFAGLLIADAVGALRLVDTRTSHTTQPERVRKETRR